MKYIKSIIGYAVGFVIAYAIISFFTGGDKLKDFEPFHNEEGRFTVLFPGEPERKLEQVQTPIGTLELVMYNAGSKKTGFIVGYADYPQEMIDNSSVDKMLDGARDGAVANVEGELVSEKVLDFYSNQAREIEVKVPKQGTIKARLILIGNRLYQVMAISQSKSILEERSPEFFDSFKVDGVG